MIGIQAEARYNKFIHYKNEVCTVKKLLLVLMMMISIFLVACGNGDDEIDETEDTDTDTTEDTDDEAASEDDAASEDEDVTEDDAADEDAAEDEDSTDEAAEEDATEEIETADAVDGNEIDVLSATFGDEFFGGAEAYEYNSIPEGSTQEDVEEMYGTHEALFDSNGRELAVYGNLAVEYSGGSAYFEGNELVDVESAADNQVENVYIFADVTVNEFTERYGVPTRNYDQFLPDEGQTPYLIYDWTRDNDYAVYGEVISAHKGPDGEDVILDAPIVSVLYKAEELETLPEPLY